MMFVFLNGSFLRENLAKVSVLDHGFLYGDGVYETLRTYNGKIWQMNEHLVRLKDSAARVSIFFPWENKQIAAWADKLVRMHGFKESRIRITVTRGENGFDFSGSKKPTILIQVAALKAEPVRIYRDGVKVVTMRGERILPETKSISLLPFVMARQETEKKKAYEALLVDEKGYVREGAMTNVFYVLKGAIFTPKTKILYGTTRDFLVKLMSRNGLGLEKDFKLEELMNADEVFITNAPRGIIPVVNIDGKKIGRGRPGPVTGKIMKLFADYVSKQSR